MINDKLIFDLGIIKHFINDSLVLSRERHEVSGYELLSPLLKASAHNTYVETVSNKADSLYKRAKESEKGIICHSFLNYISRLSKKINLNKKKVILAFDYTDEDFYGDVQGFDIYGYTGEKGVTGKFKFITCSIISDEIPEKIPLISLPIRIGHYKSSVILECLSKIKNFIGEIELIIFDRGFYDKDLMYELSLGNYSYLIFVPKHQDKQSILYPLEVGEEVAIYNEFKVNKNFSTYQGENILAFLKQIYDPKSEKNYDWVFATNVEGILLNNLVIVYKKRWRIETQFRVQDDAKIKCKSKDVLIRYFLFQFEQMLQTIWICFYKETFSFKKFLIELAQESEIWTKKPKSK